MIEGYRCYMAMTELEKRRWQKNVHRESRGVVTLLEEKWDSFDEFISGSFVWGHTNEGHDYWDEVSKRYILHDTLSPHKSFSSKGPPKPFT